MSEPEVPNYLGSMGKALLVHQHALKLLKNRMTETTEHGGYRASVTGVTVSGSIASLYVYLYDGRWSLIYKWEFTGGMANVEYKPEWLDGALDLMKRAMVLDDLADV